MNHTNTIGKLALRRRSATISPTSTIGQLALRRRFSTGNLQHIRQTEEASSAQSGSERFIKGLVALMGVVGLSWSAVHTRTLYDSKDNSCKAYWNRNR